MIHRKAKGLVHAVLAAGALHLAGGALPAHAADPYLSLFAVSHDVDEHRFSTGLGQVRTSYDRDIGFGFALGFRFTPSENFRAEIEWADRSNDVDRHRVVGGPALAGSDGRLGFQTLMFNLIYDIQVEPAFSPYVGAGIGLAKVDFENYSATGFPAILDDSDTVLVGQLIGGAWMRVTDNVHLFGDMRLVRADEPEVTTAGPVGAVENDIDYEAFSIFIGARFEY